MNPHRPEPMQRRHQLTHGSPVAPPPPPEREYREPEDLARDGLLWHSREAREATERLQAVAQDQEQQDAERRRRGVARLSAGLAYLESKEGRS